MQRFVAIGASRLQFLQALPHDPTAAARVVAALDVLAPKRIHLDLDTAAWDRLAHRPDALDGWEQRRMAAMAPYGPTLPNAFLRAVRSWVAGHAGARPSLNPGVDPDPPKGRKGLRWLDKALKRQGFTARDAASALQRLEAHYVPQAPRLADWLATRRERMAQRLVDQYAHTIGRAVCVFPYPDGDRIAERIAALSQRWGKTMEEHEPEARGTAAARRSA